MILYVLLIAHMLADFTFQTDKIAEGKKTNCCDLMIHGAIYIVVMAVGCFLCMDCMTACGMFVLIGTSHYLIDYMRIRYDRCNVSPVKQFRSFLVDQALHICVVLLVCFLQRGQEPAGLLADYFEQYQIDRILRYILLFVTIMDPASVLVKLLSSAISDTTKEDPIPGQTHAGSVIGKLERLIIALLVMKDAFGSIGFVLTAKSLARHERLTDPKFAEIYLVGTLSSTAIAMVLALLLR